MNIAFNARLFFLIGLNEAKRYSFYPIEFISAFLNRAVAIFLTALFWVIAARFGDQTTLDSNYLVGYYLVLSGMMQISFANLGVANSLLKRIKSGSVSSDMLKPIDTFAFEFARNAGWQVQFLIVSTILTIVGVIYASSGMNPFLVLWAIANMIAINYGFNRAVACVGFYVVEAAGIKNAILHALRLLQGMLIPLSLLPVFAQDILAFTPFPASLYMPIATLLGDALPLWQYALSSVWGVMILFLSRKLWLLSLKKYEAIGL